MCRYYRCNWLLDCTDRLTELKVWLILWLDFNDRLTQFTAWTGWLPWQLHCHDSLTALKAWLLVPWQLDCLDSMTVSKVSKAWLLWQLLLGQLDWDFVIYKYLATRLFTIEMLSYLKTHLRHCKNEFNVRWLAAHHILKHLDRYIQTFFLCLPADLSKGLTNLLHNSTLGKPSGKKVSLSVTKGSWLFT